MILNYLVWMASASGELSYFYVICVIAVMPHMCHILFCFQNVMMNCHDEVASETYIRSIFSLMLATCSCLPEKRGLAAIRLSFLNYKNEEN